MRELVEGHLDLGTRPAIDLGTRPAIDLGMRPAIGHRGLEEDTAGYGTRVRDQTAALAAYLSCKAARGSLVA